MLFLLSPAKSLDYERPLPPELPLRRPAHVDESAVLIEALRTRSAEEVAALMDLSPALAELNVERYAAWRPRFTARNSRPALLAFDGDVYDGLDAKTLGSADLAWADEHLVILSGLHGMLRPLDALQPYRLEMGTALPNPRGANLYAYWGELVTAQLNRRARAEVVPVVVNLASQEYFRVVRPDRLKPRVVDCVFEDWKDGQWKVIGFFAKRARGMMARHAIDRRVETPDGLKDFTAAGYAYDDAASRPERLVFRRRAPP
jgi:uncharacterized protein